MKSRIRPSLLAVKNYTPGKPIEEVQREFGLDEVIKLASNENCMGASPKALAAVRKNLSRVNRYPDALSFYLKEKLAAFLGVESGNIVVGNGSDEIICMAVRTFVEPGDEVVIASPTFLIYEIVSQLHDARITLVPVRKDLKHDLAAMKAAITDRTKIVFIANPDNPTGTYVNRAELEAFLDGLPGHVVVFLDEAYYEFAADVYADYPNGLNYLGRPGLIVSRTFSKAYGLAGLRVGYAVAGTEVAAYLDRTREPFNVNLLAQVAAEAALGDKAFLKKTLAHVAKEREFLCAEIVKMGLSFIPSATNFLVLDLKRDCKEVFTALLRKGVIVRDMKAWGLDTHIRVTIGTRTENRKFITTLKGVLA